MMTKSILSFLLTAQWSMWAVKKKTSLWYTQGTRGVYALWDPMFLLSGFAPGLCALHRAVFLKELFVSK